MLDERTHTQVLKVYVDVTHVLHVGWTSRRCYTLGGSHTGVTR